LVTSAIGLKKTKIPPGNNRGGGGEKKKSGHQSERGGSPHQNNLRTNIKGEECPPNMVFQSTYSKKLKTGGGTTKSEKEVKTNHPEGGGFLVAPRGVVRFGLSNFTSKKKKKKNSQGGGGTKQRDKKMWVFFFVGGFGGGGPF